jgi:hypothetical protein
VREAAGLDPKLVLYCARHEFAGSYLEHGGLQAALQKILEHPDRTTTQKYLQIDVDGPSTAMIGRRILFISGPDIPKLDTAPTHRVEHRLIPQHLLLLILAASVLLLSAE